MQNVGHMCIQMTNRLPSSRLRKIVVLRYPASIESMSSKRFGAMIEDGLKTSGLRVCSLRPSDLCRLITAGTIFSKWAGYIDMYIIFPAILLIHFVYTLLTDLPSNSQTLYFFCDESLSLWLPLISALPIHKHVLHCHTQLNQLVAFGNIPYSNTRLLKSGYIYQFLIRCGMRYGRNFIFNSNQTCLFLLNFCGVKPVFSRIIHLGLSFPFKPALPDESDQVFDNYEWPRNRNYFLHISCLQWYKNFEGICHLYLAYLQTAQKPLDLWVVTDNVSDQRLLALMKEVVRYGAGWIHVISNLDDQHALQALYTRSDYLLFPSHFEGFGWPVIEALACGCRVFTTKVKPMTEIGGPYPTYVLPLDDYKDMNEWAFQALETLNKNLEWPKAEIDSWKCDAIEWTKQFSREKYIHDVLDFCNYVCCN